MSRLSVFVLAAAMVAGAMIAATDVSARPHGGGASRGAAGGQGAARSFSGPRSLSGTRNFSGGGIRHGFRGSRGFAHPRRYRGIGPYYLPYAYGYSSCYRWRWVPTRYGMRMRRVNVCGVPFAFPFPGAGLYYRY